MILMIRTYSELIKLDTFEERFEYLKLNGQVGMETFGFDRYLNQQLYNSYYWKSKVRDKIIIRDLGCDLACEDRPICGKIIIHHMNPISSKDIIDRNEMLFDPEYLIAVSHNTHEAIHYGDKNLLIKMPKVRSKFDTCPWKK